MARQSLSTMKRKDRDRLMKIIDDLVKHEDLIKFYANSYMDTELPIDARIKCADRLMAYRFGTPVSRLEVADVSDERSMDGVDPKRIEALMRFANGEPLDDEMKALLIDSERKALPPTTTIEDADGNTIRDVTPLRVIDGGLSAPDKGDDK